MNKLLFTFLLLFLIIYSECSKCTDFKLTTTENTSDTTTENTKDTTGGETSETEGKTSETEGKTSETEGKTSETVAETTEAEAQTTETEAQTTETETIETVNERRRLANEVTEKDCKGLETRDNNKYQCVVKSDHKGCEEVSKEGANKLQISLSILILLFLI